MSEKTISSVYSMPEGKYYVGDLCYILKDDSNPELTSLVVDRSKHCVNSGKFNFKSGCHFLSFLTSYGDGFYYDQRNRRYAVDSGCIGAIKIDAENVDPEKLSSIKKRKLGNVINFDKKWNAYLRNGTMYFGSVVIHTED